MYKVICRFADLKDENHIYEIGDIYPRGGHEPSLKRIRELLGSKNKIGVPLIEEVFEESIMIEPETGDVHVNTDLRGN